jgi:hypothetical protein
LLPTRWARRRRARATIISVHRVWLASCAAAALAIVTGASASGPIVPLSIQRTIKRHHPEIAYLPTRLPAGDLYRSWGDGRNAFSIWFGITQPRLGFHVSRSPCSRMHSLMGDPRRTFRVNGVKVYWSATTEDQQAWRCFTVGHTPILLSSSQSIFGDDYLNTPTRVRDALDLARLIARVRRIS